MSFWQLEGENENALDKANSTGGNFETSNNLPPIPKGTCVRALISNIKWDQSDRDDDVDGRYINIEWSILAPELYAKRKIFHKVKLNTNDPSKGVDQNQKARNRHLMMLSAINTNCGSRLPVDREPTDADLFQCLLNVPMIIKLETWDDRETKEPAGNWVSAVSSDNATGKLKVSEAKQQQQQQATSRPVNTNQRRPVNQANGGQVQHPRQNPNFQQQQQQAEGVMDADSFDDDVPF